MKGNCIPLLLSDEGGEEGEGGREGGEREGGRGKEEEGREEGREVGGVKCKCEISVARRHVVDKQEV